MISDKFSGRSRGYGFVDMEDADAQNAIAGMTGYKWEEREITVNEARPRTEQAPVRERSRDYSFAF